jgi:Uma2 family endonuclease
MALLIEMLAFEMDIAVRNLDSTTFKRQDLLQGFEPDICFYIQSIERISGKIEIDLVIDPPPDLVLEIAITHPSLDKLSIYAAVGVAEVWRYDGHTVTIARLAGGTYHAQEESRALPGVTRAVISHFMETSQTLKRTEWLRSVRTWAQQQETSR